MTVLRQVIQKMLTHPIESPCLPPRYNALRRVSNGVYKWAFLKPEQFEHPVAGGSPFIPTRSQDLYNRVYNYLIATHPKESGRVYAKDYMGMVPDLKDCARSAQESVLRTTIRRIEQAALLPESHAERRFLGWKEGSLHPRYHQLKIIKR